MSIQTIADAFATRDTAGEAAATSTGERYYLHGDIIAEWLDTTTVRLYRPDIVDGASPDRYRDRRGRRTVHGYQGSARGKRYMDDDG